MASELAAGPTPQCFFGYDLALASTTSRPLQVSPFHACIVAPPTYARPPYASSVLDLPLVFAAKLLQSSFAAYASLEVGYDL